MKAHLLAIIVLGLVGCVPVAQREHKAGPQHREASIGEVVIRATKLEITGRRPFSEISSHFADTPIADKPGFMYAGTDTAGIPVTGQSRTVFWLCGEQMTPAITFRPEEATLTTHSGQVIACITNETIHMSCPGWIFPNWRMEHGRLSGFIVFPLVDDSDGELRLPYVDQGNVEELVFRFGQEK